MIEEFKNKEYWDTLIIDRLSGCLSDKNSNILNEWLAESAKHQSYFDGMKDLWDSLGVADASLPFDYERAYSLFVKRIHEKEEKRTARLSKKKFYFILRVAAIAAVMIPFVLLGYYTLLYFNTHKSDIEPLLSEIVSPNGSKAQLRLTDGTVVWLNSGSKLFFNDGFGKENRMLELTGEAYLDVSHNEKLPLVLKVGELSVKVLGTKFNVNAYPENEEVKVSLLKGSVNMTDNQTSRSVILKPMETGIYRVHTNQITVEPGLEKNALNWMKNQLVFNGETFGEIARILEQRFDVRIRVHNEKLRQRRFGGDFGKEESIDKVLKVMAVNGKFKYTIKNDMVDIY